MDEYFIHISFQFNIREPFMSQTQEPQSITIDFKKSSQGNFNKTLYVNLTVFSRNRFNTILQIFLPASITLIGLWAFLSLHHLFYLLIFIVGSYFLYKSIISWQKIEIHNEQIVAKPLIGRQKNYFANKISEIQLITFRNRQQLMYGTSIEFNDGAVLNIPSSVQGKSIHETILKWSEVYKV
jgi:hypothetical protein